MAPKPKRAKNKDNARRSKKKISILSQERVEYVDYKDVNLLRRFMSERAKIRARRVTGNDARQQRAVARAIRVAREMALLPYSVRQVTHRNKGKGRDRDRGLEREAPPTPAPVPSEPPPSGLAADVSTDVSTEDIPTNDAPTNDAPTNLGETIDEALESPEADAAVSTAGAVEESS